MKPEFELWDTKALGDGSFEFRSITRRIQYRYSNSRDSDKLWAGVSAIAYFAHPSGPWNFEAPRVTRKNNLKEIRRCSEESA